MGSCCGGGTHQIASTNVTESVAADDDTVYCPVMPGSAVDKEHAEEAGLVREYDGRTYWFCCESCAPLFDANPERYATVG